MKLGGEAFSIGKIGDSYSLEVATTAHVNFFLTFHRPSPMARVSQNTHPILSLSETTRFANFN